MHEILEKVKAYDRILLFRHFRPDGDATGSTKGLQAILRLTFPEKEIYLQNDDFSDYMAFLGPEDAPLDDSLYADALGIVLDTGTAARISNQKYKLCKELIKIDHHIPVENYAPLCWVEEERSSVCEMVAHFYYTFRDQLKIDLEAATYLYTGMVNAILFGIDERDAVRAATYNPARQIGALNEVGSIENGKVADFVLCDSELNRKAVYLAGKAL